MSDWKKIRLEELVEESRAFILSAFSKTIVVNNASLTAGDTVTLGVEDNGDTTNTVLTAGTSFTIGATSSASATNLAAECPSRCKARSELAASGSPAAE